MLRSHPYIKSLSIQAWRVAGTHNMKAKVKYYLKSTEVKMIKTHKGDKMFYFYKMKVTRSCLSGVHSSTQLNNQVGRIVGKNTISPLH